MITKKAGLWVAMTSLVAAGLALGDSASAKTLGALIVGPSGLNGEYYTQCVGSAHIFALAIKTADSPAGASLYRCESTAFYADTWAFDTGCHPASTKHRVQIRTSTTLLAQSPESIAWTNGATVNFTASSRVNGAGACANNVLTALSLGS